MAQQQLSSDEMFGIAKKINRELEQFPMHTHSAIVEMVRVGMQHRNLGLQAEMQAKQQEQQEKMVQVQQQQMQLAQMAAQREAASRIQLVGKTEEAAPAPAKAEAEEADKIVQ